MSEPQHASNEPQIRDGYYLLHKRIDGWNIVQPTMTTVRTGSGIYYTAGMLSAALDQLDGYAVGALVLARVLGGSTGVASFVVACAGMDQILEIVGGVETLTPQIAESWFAYAERQQRSQPEPPPVLVSTLVGDA